MKKTLKPGFTIVMLIALLAIIISTPPVFGQSQGPFEQQVLMEHQGSDWYKMQTLYLDSGHNGAPQTTPGQSLRTASPRLNVNVSYGWVTAYGFQPGIELTLSVLGGPSQKGTTDASGELQFTFYDFDLLGGQTLTASSSTGSVSYKIQTVFVENINTATDLISGRGDPGVPVELGDCTDTTAPCVTNSQPIVPDAQGMWSYSFSGTKDIDSNSKGWAIQSDTNGNSTVYMWQVPNPELTVLPIFDRAIIMKLSPNNVGTVSIGAKTWSFVASSRGIAAVDTIGHDVVPGDRVIVQQGPYRTEHTVLPLTVTMVDRSTSTVGGSTTANSVVNLAVWTNSYMDTAIAQANSSGVWSFSFSGQLTFVPGLSGIAYQEDANGNSTNIDWYVPDPRIKVFPERNTIQLYEWPPNETVSLDIQGAQHAIRVDATGFGQQNFSPIDIQPGDSITAIAAGYTKEHTVYDFQVRGVDLGASRIYGTAKTGQKLTVFLWVDSLRYNLVDVMPDSAGNWSLVSPYIKQVPAGWPIYVSQSDSDGDDTSIMVTLPTVYLPLILR